MGDNKHIAPVVENAPRQQIIGASIYCSPKFCRYKSWIMTLTLKYPLMILHWRLTTYAFSCARFKRVDCQNIPDAKLCVHIYLRIWFALKLWIQIIQYLPMFLGLTATVNLPYGKSSSMIISQFPRLAYAMTMNRSQDQKFSQVLVELSIHAFSHGHLYVAINRIGNVTNIAFYTSDIANQVPVQISVQYCCPYYSSWSAFINKLENYFSSSYMASSAFCYEN